MQQARGINENTRMARRHLCDAAEADPELLAPLPRPLSAIGER